MQVLHHGIAHGLQPLVEPVRTLAAIEALQVIHTTLGCG